MHLSPEADSQRGALPSSLPPRDQISQRREVEGQQLRAGDLESTLCHLCVNEDVFLPDHSAGTPRSTRSGSLVSAPADSRVLG